MGIVGYSVSGPSNRTAAGDRVAREGVAMADPFAKAVGPSGRADSKADLWIGRTLRFRLGEKGAVIPQFPSLELSSVTHS